MLNRTGETLTEGTSLQYNYRALAEFTKSQLVASLSKSLLRIILHELSTWTASVDCWFSFVVVVIALWELLTTLISEIKMSFFHCFLLIGGSYNISFEHPKLEEGFSTTSCVDTLSFFAQVKHPSLRLRSVAYRSVVGFCRFIYFSYCVCASRGFLIGAPSLLPILPHLLTISVFFSLLPNSRLPHLSEDSLELLLSS